MICGSPLYEYDHITEWSETGEHDPENITLLCDMHHKEKTNGLLPVEVVREANRNPHNLSSGASNPYRLHYSGGTASIEVGSNVTRGNGQEAAAVMIDGVPLISFKFEGGHCLLSMILFNEVNEPVLQIVNNHLLHSIDPWDIEFVGSKLTVRAAHGDIFVDIDFLPPDKIVISRGKLLYNGVELHVNPEYVLLVNNAGLFERNVAEGCLITMNLGFDPAGNPSAVRIPSIRRYGIDQKAALAWARKAHKANQN